MVDQYDNRGSGWVCKAVRGQALIGGKKYSMVMYEISSPNPKAPAYEMHLTDPDTKHVDRLGLFREDKEGSKRILKGSVVLINGEWWVSVFQNDTNGDKNRPALGFSFQPKEPKPVEPPQPVPASPYFSDLPKNSDVTGTDIPF